MRTRSDNRFARTGGRRFTRRRDPQTLSAEDFISRSGEKTWKGALTTSRFSAWLGKRDDTASAAESISLPSADGVLLNLALAASEHTSIASIDIRNTTTSTGAIWHEQSTAADAGVATQTEPLAAPQSSLTALLTSQAPPSVAASSSVELTSSESAIDAWSASWRADAAELPCIRCTGRFCGICSLVVGTGAGQRPVGGMPTGFQQANLNNTVEAGLLSDNGPAPAQTFSATALLNPIVQENMLEGNPESEWGIDGAGSDNIEGFATNISVNHGDTVSFKINTDSTHYRVDIYRIGYYGGDGARKVASFEKNLAAPQIQPVPLFDPELRLVDAGNWNVSATWEIPDDAVSGVYFAKLTRLDGEFGQNIIPFIVRDDENASDITFQTSDTTWQAYNWWGGYNFYGGVDGGLHAGRSYAVSYNRPIITRGGGLAAGPQDFIFSVEYPAIRWLEQNGYNVNYISGVDTARDGAQLLNTNVFLSVGHDEYWSADQRANVEAARDAGVNLMFWGGNNMYWQTRWETSIDASGTPYRTLVSYKETWSLEDIDIGHTTSTWRDPVYGAGQPENAVMGTIFTVDSYRLDTITVPYDLSNFRFWTNTEVADLQPGQVYSLTPNLLGYEWDSDLDNGHRPAGLINLSQTTVDVQQMLLDYGNTVGDGTASHALTLYRAPSGALVFGAGTVYWAWGLDDNHDLETTPVDRNVQQAMVNLFAEMGVQPDTLMASLAVAAQTTDHSAPTSTITIPTAGQTYHAYDPITITGTAVDSGGGRVAVVEVSTDNGATWRRATGYENWTYTWTPIAGGSYTIKSRSVDDSVNLEAPGTGVTISVDQPLTRTLFAGNEIPSVLSDSDQNGVNLGVKFVASQTGTIVGIKYFKGLSDTGTHSGSLWTSSGTLLATATFTNETLSGWQTVTFSSPVTISAGTSYVASYHSNGHYASTTGFFNNAYSNGPLSVAGNGGVGNSFYLYGDQAAFPTNSATGANYWVDVLFVPSGDITNQIPVTTNDVTFTQQNTPLVIATSQLLANDHDPDGDILSIATVGAAIGGSVSYNAQTGTITFTPAPGFMGSARFDYAVTDGQAIAPAKVDVSVVPPFTSDSLFNGSETPAVLSDPDTAQVNLGVRFVASGSGTIVGIKFYKGVGDGGTHTGSLWTSTGELLATATFASESASGWQVVTFSSPIAISAGVTYVASYQSNGHYAATGNYFNSGYANGSLSAPSAAGVYLYGGGNLFPTSTSNANYWVDVLFVSSGAPTAVNDSFTTSHDTPHITSTSTLLQNDSDPNDDPLVVVAVADGVGGTVSLQNNTVTFTPFAGFVGNAAYSYQISDGTNPPTSATVNVLVAPSSANVSLFSPSDTPASLADPDAASVNLGVRFTASVSGMVTGLKYYKSATDTGTHVGSLWTSAGTLLADVTFTNETASGWQFVSFANPIAISAGATYVASYLSNGHYVSTGGYFASGHTSGVLTALSGANGVYAYATQSVFPANTYNSANYWVDVLFTPTGTPVAANDDGFLTTQGTALAIEAGELLANDTDPNADPIAIVGVQAVSGGTVSYDSQSETVTFTPTTGYVGTASFTYDISDGHSTATGTVELVVLPPASSAGLFAYSDTPANLTDPDTSSVNLGVTFTSSQSGTIAGMKFYKGTGDNGTHVGSIWTSTGTLLTTATFTNETASGWQFVTFANPVAISAGTTYVASYLSSGHYASTPGYFSSSHTSGPLTASSAVYAYSGSNLFPTNASSANYWVDVIFAPGAAADPIALDDSGYTTPNNAVLGISGSALLSNDSDPNGDPISITGVTSGTGGTASYNAQTNTITFTPTAGFVGTAQFTYQIADGTGRADTAAVSVAVTSPAVSEGLFSDTATPAIVTVNDSGSVELGMKFQADVAGTISAIQFYKGPSNVGQHQVSLWTSTGTLLATAASVNETASGWQTVQLAQPVAIAGDTTYIASYHTSGFYSANSNFFSSDFSNGNLLAPSGSGSGGNGVYAYGAGSSLFPSNTYNNTNYWVDVVFLAA
jgi:hypothetical protein